MKREIGVWETIGVLVAVAALSSLAVVPSVRTEVISAGAGGTGSVQAPSGSQGGVPGSGGEAPVDADAPGLPGQRGPAPAGLACAAGRNGGATDVGVTGDSIKLGATVVDTGIGAAFLSDVRYGMQAIVNQVNASGGICGRRLNLVLKDDGWDAQRGSLFIRNLVEGEKVFALAVVPSSEGLRAATNYVREQRVPVIGSDGMLISQYTNPMIWPVAASTITAVHIMAKDAFDRGLRNFAMVYDSNFRFGVEGAFAFNAAVERLTGKPIPGYSNPLQSPRCSGRFCGIKAGQPSYQTEIEVVRSACSQDPQCDYIAYLLEPETAQTWMRGGGLQAGFNGGVRLHVGAPQPLFNRGFGVNCAQKCHDMWVWTGFVPPVEPFASDPQVARYVNAVRRTNAKADASNSFVEGGYLGMQLLVEALQRVGPNLTRDALIEALDATRFESGLSRAMRWTRNDHFANQCMMAFSFQSRPSFAGWRHERDWVCDPWPGQDIPSSET
ncbi:MAG TPA: ABC transporter substrate-binding protein [Actinomycetota bacterium]